MKLNTNKFALSTALSFSLVWIICALLVWLLPGPMMSMSGAMLHMELSTMAWELSLSGVISGLFGWALLSGGIGWLLAFVYNRLV